LIDQYDAGDPDAGIAGDLGAPFAERAADAIARSQSDQPHLRELPTDRRLLESDEALVRLVLEPTVQEQLLEAHGLSVDVLNPTRLSQTVEMLKAMPIEQLFSLMRDWAETVEPHLGDPRPSERWLRDASPDKHCVYRSRVGYDALLSWIKEESDLEPPSSDAAYRAFERDVDRPLESCHFGTLMRAIYFSRSEFPTRPLVLPSVIRDALSS
jgi:hypothetical protein